MHTFLLQILKIVPEMQQLLFPFYFHFFMCEEDSFLSLTINDNNQTMRHYKWRLWQMIFLLAALTSTTLVLSIFVPHVYFSADM